MTAGELGISDVAVNGLGPVIDSSKFCLGELILEADHGGPWGTFSPDRSRTRLAQFSRLEKIQTVGDCMEIIYGGSYPGGDDHYNKSIKWRQVFRLCRGLPWLLVETTVEWFTIGKRLRLAFPSTTNFDRGVYEIPYGVLERDRYDIPNKGYEAGGDWPALHWAGIQAPGHLLAVFNQGTPSYRVEEGTIMVSVLRSPRWHGATHHKEPAPIEDDTFVTRHYHGRLDHGTHHFRHALYAAAGNWRNSDVAWQAHLFNAGLDVLPGELAHPMPSWSFKAFHSLIAAVKRAEDGNGIILRLVEQAGEPETVELQVPDVFKTAWQCNLLEDNLRQIKRCGNSLSLDMKPWKIVTLRLA